jgi:hypothetical protein
MNWLDYAPAGLAALTCLATVLICFARTRRAEQRYARLRDDVSAFSDASVRVADTLDALLKGEVTPREAHQSSRRYLLSQAQHDVAAGESLEQVAERLHLSHDEARLMGFVALGQRRERAPRSTRSWAA